MFKRINDRRETFGRLGKSKRQKIVWNQEANFEGGVLTPNANGGFDSLAGAGSANLAVGTPAISEIYDCVVNIPDADPRYGVLSSPDSETIITIEFQINTGDLVMANLDVFQFFNTPSDGASVSMDIFFRYAAGIGFNILARIYNDAGASTNVGDWTALQNETVTVRIEWKASSAPGANDGYLRLYFDDILKREQADFDNDTHTVNTINIGCFVGLDAGTSGSFKLDNIRWRDGVFA